MKRYDNKSARTSPQCEHTNNVLNSPGILKITSAAAWLICMAVTPSVATAGYQVGTMAFSSGTTESYAYNVTDGYNGTWGQCCTGLNNPVGAYFPTPNVRPNWTTTQSGTTATNSTETSSWSKVTSNWNGAYVQGSYGASNLATGQVQGAAYSTGTYSDGTSESAMSDTLHFTVAGANATTITPITVTWTAHADWATNGPGSIGQEGYYDKLYFGSAMYIPYWSQSNADAPVFADGGMSGWASVTWGVNNQNDIQFFGIYNLLGSAVDVPFYSNLTVFSGGGAGPMAVDPWLNLVLPGNVSYTSDSGVFLTGLVVPPDPGSVPEPGSLALVGLGAVALGLSRKRKLNGKTV